MMFFEPFSLVMMVVVSVMWMLVCHRMSIISSVIEEMCVYFHPDTVHFHKLLPYQEYPKAFLLCRSAA